MLVKVFILGLAIFYAGKVRFLSIFVYFSLFLVEIEYILKWAEKFFQKNTKPFPVFPLSEEEL